MRTVDIADAEAFLPQLISAVEDGLEDEIVISRHDKPAARLLPIRSVPASGQRLGLLAGRYPPMSLREFDANNEEIGTLFYGDDG